MTKLIIHGKGGAGIKYMSIILAKSATKHNLHATLLLSYGPEARGGDITAFLTVDTNPISNPVIKKADSKIIFEKDTNNMYVLGQLSNLLNIPLNIVIETMVEETGEKYKHKIQKNIEDIKNGYL